jgi:DNA-binding LytR/AlgR family response regulator
MLKVIIVSESKNAAQSMAKKLQTLSQIDIIATIIAQDYSSDLLQKYGADFILTNNAAVSGIVQLYKQTAPRKQVTASTHQGVRVVPIESVLYFQAEHKYVTVYHTNGQLLIEDSLNSLEHEFAQDFIRIHRKTLVATKQIEMLAKNSEGKYYVKLHGRADELLVSRRQIAQVRKSLMHD